MGRFKVEMKHGEEHRIVDADSFASDQESGWLIFYQRPPQGGIREYWRARLDSVISFETMR